MTLNKYIEHTILKPDATEGAIEKLCKEAIENKFVGVCVPPFFVKKAKHFLKNSEVKIVTVIGFPLGYSSTSAKVEETKTALADGVEEIDMVVNIAALKNKDFDYLEKDIQNVFNLVKQKNAILKVIIETALLNKEEKITICKICSKLEVDFVKTSTGFAKHGAKVEDIVLMKENIHPQVKIKASGGIKTKEFAEQLIEAGATRLGTSSGVLLIK